MLVKMVHMCVKWINAFPPKGGISRMMSPRTIITGTQLDFKTDCCLPFSAYVQAHQEPSPFNTQEACTVGAICLGLTGNIQGSLKFLNLVTSRKIMCCNWTMLPIPQDMIDCMNQLNKADEQPSILTFFDCKGNLVKDLQAPVDSDTPTEIPGVQATPPLATEVMEQNTFEEPTIDVQDPENLAEPVLALEDEDYTPPAAPDEIQVEDSIEPKIDTTTADPELEDPALDLVAQPDTANDLDSEEEIQQPHCSAQATHPVTCLQPTMQGQHHHNTSLVSDSKITNVDLHILGHILTQLSLKHGLSE